LVGLIFEGRYWSAKIHDIWAMAWWVRPCESKDEQPDPGAGEDDHQGEQDGLVQVQLVLQPPLFRRHVGCMWGKGKSVWRIFLRNISDDI
jgi:hypothetical protein